MRASKWSVNPLGLSAEAVEVDNIKQNGIQTHLVLKRREKNGVYSRMLLVLDAQEAIALAVRPLPGTKKKKVKR